MQQIRLIGYFPGFVKPRGGLDIFLFILCFVFLIFRSGFSQSDPRRNHHSAVILKFSHSDSMRYYLTWSSSKNEAWEHDIFRETIHFENGELIIDSPPRRYIGSGSDEAQEPVSAAIIDDRIILSAWEDGNGETVDVHGQLHYPDGVIIKPDWIIAGGADSQHSVAVTDLRNLFLVAYTDEAPPAEYAMVKVKLLRSQDGSLVQQSDLTPVNGDNWWPVACSNHVDHAFIGWGDGDVFWGSVCSVQNDSVVFTKPISYLANIRQYFYQVVWLQRLSRFMAIAAGRDGSFACLVDTTGRLTKWQSIAAPILRESKMAAKWNEQSQSYKVVFPTGERDLAVLKVKTTEVQFEKVLQGRNCPVLQNIIWPETGIWGVFVRDFDGTDRWDDQNMVLFVCNSDRSNDAVILPVRLPAGFTTGVSQQNVAESGKQHFLNWQNFPNPFSSGQGEINFVLHISESGVFQLKIFNALGQCVKFFPSKSVQPGHFRIEWNGLNDLGNPVPNGIYFASFTINAKRISRKILILR